MQFRILASCIVFLFLVACSSSKDASTGVQKTSSAFNEKKKVAFGRAYMDATKEKILGNFEKAEELYKAALSIDSKSAAANYELGQVYGYLKKYDQAFLQFKLATELEPDNYWYKLSYATALQSQNQIKESIKEFKELVELKPKQTELKYEVAKLLINSGEKEEGIQYLNLIEDEIGINEEISFLKQRVYLSMNDVEGASNEIKKLSDHYPTELRYQGILAEIYLSNGRKEQAYEVYKRMSELQPDNYQVQFSLAEFHRKQGNQEKYLDNISKAFSNPEMDIDDKVKYILTFYQVDGKNEEKKQEGIELCRKITEAHPNNAKSWALLADFLYFDDQIQNAKQAYFRTLELDSSRFPVWNQLLIILSDDNDIDALLNYGSRAVDLFPNQPTVYLLYGLGLSRDKQYEKAIEYLSLGKDLVVDNQALKSQIYSSIGDANHELKKYEQSDEAYEMALRLDPNNVLVLNNYSYYLSLRKEKLEKAKEMSLKSNTLAPNQSSFQDTYAWILFQLGDYTNARVWIDKAIETDKNPSGVLLEHKGDILYQLGDVEEAVEFWKKAQQKEDASELIQKKIKDRKYYE